MPRCGLIKSVRFYLTTIFFLGLDTLTFYRDVKGHQKMRYQWILIVVMVVFFFFIGNAFAGDDPIHEKCMNQADDPPPWCYQMEVERIGDAGLCENILKYWPKAVGVHGVCYYNLARKQKDCSLCSFIENADIKKMCELDVCK